MSDERDCYQCGQDVVVGHHLVTGGTINEAGEMVLETEIRHYDCLPVHLRNADEFVATAVAAAEGGIKDAALQEHLEGVMANGS